MLSDSTQMRGRIDMVATAACLGTLCCWSLGPIFIAQLTRYVDSWTQNVLRYTVACLFWLPALLYFRRTGRLEKRTWRRAVLPALANTTMQSLWAVTFYYMGPAFAVLLSKTSVLWVAALSLILFADERALIRSRRFWGGMALALIGVFGVLYFKDDFTATRTLTGILIALACASMWGLYAISIKIAFRQIDSRIGFGVVSIYTTVGLWLVALPLGKIGECTRMPLVGWLAVVVSGVTAIALGHVFFYTAIRRIGATLPTLVILTQPLVVFSISSVVFRERLNGLQLLFGLVLLAGAGLSVWAQEHLRRPPRAS